MWSQYFKWDACETMNFITEALGLFVFYSLAEQHLYFVCNNSTLLIKRPYMSL